MTDPRRVPRSCTLPGEEQPSRLAEWDALFAGRLALVSRPGPLLLRLELDGGPGVGDRVRDLVARESACCSFFAFTLTEDRSDAPGEDLDRPPGTGDGTGRGGRIRLGIAVDAAHEGVVEALATRTRAFVDRNSPGVRAGGRSLRALPGATGRR
ncbi:hypothetical protein ABZZ37_19260 [Streptomyces sp. NPDC006464]|uniref:hypothetical protein n=1 Tax=unclassified Streptomyces TaxID=2593676 RepID=UPI0033B4011F